MYDFNHFFAMYECPSLCVPGFNFTLNICVPSSPALCILYIWIQIIIISLLIWYMDSVRNSNNGVGRGYLFFLTHSFWFGSKKKIQIQSLEDYQNSNSIQNSNDDSNEIREMNEVDVEKSLLVVGIEKIFKSLFRKSVHAVRGVNIVAEKGSCISLLGHNGAGKS